MWDQCLVSVHVILNLFQGLYVWSSPWPDIPSTLNLIWSMTCADVSPATPLRWVKAHFSIEADTVLLVMIRYQTGLSPFEACLQVADTDNHSLSYVLADPLFFHLLLYQARTYLDWRPDIEMKVHITHMHYGEVLRLLQNRLDLPNLAISDAIILVVAALIMSAHDADDGVIAAKHMAGFQKIVELRGGVRALTHNNHRMQRKVCRYFVLSLSSVEI